VVVKNIKRVCKYDFRVFKRLSVAPNDKVMIENDAEQNSHGLIRVTVIM
jgi:hypothetical protein